MSEDADGSGGGGESPRDGGPPDGDTGESDLGDDGGVGAGDGEGDGDTDGSAPDVDMRAADDGDGGDGDATPGAGPGTGTGPSSDGPGLPTEAVPDPAAVTDGLRATADRLRSSRVFQAVVALTALALLARLLLLGQRAAHWDEGRVAYWVLRYARTGYFEYRAIVHGPFLFHVNKYLFWILGPSDFVMRLPVAVVGGVMPASAWLFRERLRDAEVVALAAILAGNPLLLYYSRFMRNDVLVAGFVLFSLAFFVRLLDTRRLRYLYLGVGSFALALTTKENAIVYLACWLGALALLLDHRLFRFGSDGPPGDGDGTVATDGGEATARAAGAAPASTWTGWLEAQARTRVGALLDRPDAPRYLLATVGVAAVEFLAIIVFFYAPRAGAAPGDVGLWKAVFGLNPGMLADVLGEATVGAWEELYGTWVSTSHDLSVYPDRLRNYILSIKATAGVVGAFSLVGFVADRYAPGGPRDLVAMAGYWGFVSVVGYPYATDIWAPWAVVHAVVPLAIPAAVGVALVYRWGRDAFAEGDDVTAALAAVVLLLAALPAGVTAVDGAYLGSDTHERVLGSDERNQYLLQWAQPENDLKATLATVERIAATNEGTDVLYFGSTGANGDSQFWYVANRSCLARPSVGEPRDPCASDTNWHSRLPLPWYMEAYGAETNSTPPGADPAAVLQDPPPVVFAYGWDREAVESELPARYEAHSHRFKLWSEDVVVFVDPEAVPG